MGKGSLLSGQAKKYEGNQKHKPGCPKGKLSKQVSVEHCKRIIVLAYFRVSGKQKFYIRDL